jgi:hypothetical protein
MAVTHRSIRVVMFSAGLALSGALAAAGLPAADSVPVEGQPPKAVTYNKT